jgi:AcrR family transcriptional regulator
MPKLWTDTVQSHRQEVRQAILDAVGQLVEQQGLLAVTMSEVAERAGIGRATLYKYYPDVQTLLAAWHQQHVRSHLQALTALRDQGGSPEHRLREVLEAYARICQRAGRRGDSQLGALLHQGPEIGHVQHQLQELFRDLITEAAEAGAVRHDIAADELANYCLHALDAAADLNPQAVDRLVRLVLTGLSTSAV